MFHHRCDTSTEAIGQTTVKFSFVPVLEVVSGVYRRPLADEWLDLSVSRATTATGRHHTGRQTRHHGSSRPQSKKTALSKFICFFLGNKFKGKEKREKMRFEWGKMNWRERNLEGKSICLHIGHYIRGNSDPKDRVPCNGSGSLWPVKPELLSVCESKLAWP